MSIIVKETFRSLGYNVELPGSEMYFDLIYEVMEGIKEGLSNSEIKEMLPAYGLELYHFCYEIGRFKFYEHIEEFLKSKKKIRKKKRTVNVNEINQLDLDFDNQLIYFAKYFVRKEKELNPAKEYVKK